MDKESDEDLDITSMIDMTFLLLTFFMVTSTMDPVSSAELPPSKTGRMVETKDRLEIMLQLPDDLDWNPESPGAAPVSIEQVRIFLADQSDELLSPAELSDKLRDGFQEMDQPKAVLYAHKRMPSGIVNEVLRIAREAGASETSVGVTVPK